jgi:hypothetical protein
MTAGRSGAGMLFVIGMHIFNFGSKLVDRYSDLNYYVQQKQ